MAWVAPLVAAGASLFGQDKANKDNRNLNIQNREWLTSMENTAVRRRMIDLKGAGLNPALAAVGQGAQTPNTSPAVMESTTKDAAKHVSEAASTAISAMQAKANVAYTQASTAKELALARSATVDAANQERLGSYNADTKRAQEIQKLESGELDMEIKRITRDMSAAQLNQFQRTRSNLEAAIQQQVETGKINLDALRNIASVGGIEAGTAGKLIKLLIDIVRSK